MNGLMSQQAQSLINQSQESKNTETGVPGLFTGFNYPKPQQGRPIVSADDISRYLGWLGQGGGLQSLSEAGQSLFGPQGRQVAQYAMGLAENPQTSLLGMGQEGVLNQAMDFVNPMAKVGGLLGIVDDPISRLQTRMSNLMGKREKLAQEFLEGGSKDVDLLRRVRNIDSKMRDVDVTQQRIKAENAPKPPPLEETYKGLHEAPMRDSGGPGHNLADIYPDDIYGYQGAQYYGHHGGNHPMDLFSINKIRRMKGSPEEPIYVYRAIPKNIKAGINKGDWITINKDYAKEHGESQFGKDFNIVTKRVKAKDIFTNGDSIHEWGYDPQ